MKENNISKLTAMYIVTSKQFFNLKIQWNGSTTVYTITYTTLRTFQHTHAKKYMKLIQLSVILSTNLQLILMLV